MCFNLQSNNAARQVKGKCCPYYRILTGGVEILLVRHAPKPPDGLLGSYAELYPYFLIRKFTLFDLTLEVALSAVVEI